jgi:hypothetical protein
MQKWTHSIDIVSSPDRKVWRIYSNRKLANKEPELIRAKKSLPKSSSFGEFPGQFGEYEIIEIFAADGWESAE